MKPSTAVNILCSLVVGCSLACAQPIPNASVNPSTIALGASVTLTRDGYCPAGLAWTENVIWQPDGQPDVLGNMSSFGSSSYTPHAGAGTYWYQFRLVDNDINFQDQWICFTVVASQPTPNAAVTPTEINDGDSVTLIPDGTVPGGLGWTESTIWQPNGQPETLGNKPLGVGFSYAPHGGPGTYWWQFRLVDAAQQYQDQWLSFTVDAYGYVNLATSIYLSYPVWNQTQVNYSINDNGTVAGSTTYTQNAGGDPYLTFTMGEAWGGPGYVVWNVHENHGNWMPGYSYTIERLMVATYIRASRSWQVVNVANVRWGYGGYYIAYLYPFQANLDSLIYLYRLEDNNYNIWEETGTYSIPKQRL